MIFVYWICRVSKGEKISDISREKEKKGTIKKRKRNMKMWQKKNKVGICYANKSIIQFRIDIEFGMRNLQEFRKFAEAAGKKGIVS